MPDEDLKIPEEEPKNDKMKVRVVEEIPVVEDSVNEPSKTDYNDPEHKPIITPLTQGDLVSNENGSSSKLPLFLMFILGLVVGVLLAGGGMYYKYQMMTSASPTPEPVVETPTPTPSPTPEPVVDVSTLKVQVLNGSGKAGEANKVKALLEKGGFKSVVVDNAKKYDFTTTEISLKPNAPTKIYTHIYEALKSDYKVKESVEQLPSDSKFDAVITVGTEKVSN